MKHQSAHKFVEDSRNSGAARKRAGAPRGKPRAAHRAGLQYAALPHRNNRSEVLLITSRETGRWVLPKGWPMKGKKAHAAAAREAREEAGIRGKVGKNAVGRYSYGKRLANGAVLTCTVEVYPLAVERQLRRWPEQGQRTLGWFSALDAAALVDEPELASLIAAFAEKPAG